jgi:glycosyltransferase 2 family protein
MGESDRAMTEANALVPKSRARSMWPRAALGYALAFVCLVWVFHDFDFGDLVRRTASMNLYWVAAAVLCDVLSYVCQGARWRLLLRPLGHVTVLHSTQAIYAGLFVNEVLPMKLGEVVRALLVSRWMKVKLGSVAASILVERMCDGVWLAAGIVLATLFVPLPHKLVETGDLFAVGILVTLVLLAMLTVAGRRASLNGPTHVESDADEGPGVRMTAGGGEPRSFRLKSWLFKNLSVIVGRLSFDLRVIARTRMAVWAFALSPAMLLLQGLSFWIVMRAYGLHLPFTTGVLVFLIVHLGSALPNAPANIGTYQFFTVLGLTLFGVDKTTSAGFSLVVFAILTVPLWAIGFWALGRSGLTLLEVSRVRQRM